MFPLRHGVAWPVWVEAARPSTLPAAVIPVLLATVLAAVHHSADFPKAAVCLGFALLVQIGTNFANDYFDFIKGADTSRRVGPRRAVAAGLVTPDQMRRAIWLAFGAAFLLGLLLVRDGGWWLLPVGLLSIASGLAYTGGPWPLGYNGLGDIFVFAFFGLVAVGATFYVQAGYLAPAVLPVGAAVGLLAANILVVNNYRDAETDATAGKRTLVVRYGKKFAVWQYALSALVALLAAPALLLSGYRGPVLLPLLLTPWAVNLTRRLAVSSEPKEQIALLAATARFLAAYGGLLGVGLLLGK